MDRRRFLKLTGGSLGAAMAGQVLLAGRAWGANPIALKVGVILPTEGAYPAMADNVLAGVRQGFDERAAATGVQAVIATEAARHGYYHAAEAADRLLSAFGADVVISGVSTPVASRLASTFEARQVPLVVANTGAHVPRPADRSTHVLHASLAYWQSSFGMGSWAAGALGKTAFLATSFPESGYDASYAFRRAFESAGGTVVGSAITHRDAAAPGMDKAFAAIAAARPSFVYALYSNAQAVEFVKAYRGAGLSAPLAGGGFIAEDYVLAEMGEAARAVKSGLAWTATQTTTPNTTFVNAFRERNGREADALAVLGYDAARLVATGARRAIDAGKGVRWLIEALSGVTLSSPRGALVVDGDANVVNGRVHVRSVVPKDGRLRSANVTVVGPYASFPAAMQPLQSELASGFVNEYLTT